MKTIKELLYDDCCHLKKYSKKPQKADCNEVTKYFAELSKHVDKFHFKNHTDTWCQKECNPYDIPNLEGVNSPICKQLFKK